MTLPPIHIKYAGRTYKRADTLNVQEEQALSVLVDRWLADGYRKLFQQSFAHLDVENLAAKMADKFGVYVGELGEDLPWEEYAKQIKGKKEQ